MTKYLIQRLPIFLFFSLQYAILAAQPVQRSGIINHYAAVAGIDSCTGRLAVSDTMGFRKGMDVLIVQMQGAVISTANSPLFGVVTNLGSAGRWERNSIDSVGIGSLFLTQKLLHTYNWTGKVQVVTLPVLADVVVTDTLKARPWNGTTGGVLALSVAGTLTLKAPIWADGAGFRGGATAIASNNNCNGLIPEAGYVYALGNWRGSLKGEGISGVEVGREMGRGPQATGGGGGNDHNSGGGGGGNFAAGGRGGNNSEPQVFGCDGFYPGLGGYGVSQAPDRLFLGGGGGAGHANNTPLKSTGGNGGGLIWIEAGHIDGSTPIITANGTAAATAMGDGAGGGGAGGTIWLKAKGGTPDLVVRANGGAGGNTDASGANRCHGPGGGGSGGRILTNLPGTGTLQGGAAGVITNAAGNCQGSSGGAVAGASGSIENISGGSIQNTTFWQPQILQSPQNDTVCPGDTAIFQVVANAGNWTYQWQESINNNWQNLSNTGTILGVQTPDLRIKQPDSPQVERYFRCRVMRPGCVEKYTNSAVLTNHLAPKAIFSVPDTVTGCSGAKAFFEHQSLRTKRFEWFFSGGVPTHTTEAVPQVALSNSGTYTATLIAFGTCPASSDTLQRIFTARLLPAATADFSFTTLSNLQVKFTATATNATSIHWLFGDNTAPNTQTNPTHFYAQPGKYIVSLIAANGCGAKMIQKKVSP